MGDTFCAAIVWWSGPLKAGEKAMEPFRDLAPVAAEMAGPMPYPMLNAAFDAVFPEGIRSYWKGSFVTELTDAAIEQHARQGPGDQRLPGLRTDDSVDPEAGPDEFCAAVSSQL